MALNNYINLCRLNRPIGIWLLFWPCVWGFALAPSPLSWKYIIIFAVGAVIMRSAGCTYNDIIDMPLDRQVKRTRGRPLVQGILSVKQAWLFFIVQLVGAASLLVFLPMQTITLAILSVILVVMYPWMKRWTFWPQAFLGLTFGGWGTLMAWSTTGEPFTLVTWLCALAAICWVIGYDTIYAHQDREDDLIAGIKSTALLSGSYPRAFIIIWYTIMVLCFVVVGVYRQFPGLYFCGLLGVLSHLGWQCLTLDVQAVENCRARFLSNAYLGGYIAILLLTCRLF